MLRCAQLLRFALYPFINFFLVYFIKEIKIRKVFENKNSKGFNQLGVQADIAFEVSSEGELEQALPFILYNLDKKLRVELIFSSKSVEHKCLDLKNQYEDQLMIYRLPLITGSSFWINGQNVSMWMTSKKLVLCRYDFFPELLLLKDVKLYLISATLINRKNLNESHIKKWYWQQVYNKFEIILVACQSDLSRFIELGINPKKIKILEARVIQISKRVQNCNLINCSPIGLSIQSDSTLLSQLTIKKYESIIDINYNIEKDYFNFNSNKKVDGKSMFIYQALKSLDIWFESNISNKLDYKYLEQLLC